MFVLYMITFIVSTHIRQPLKSMQLMNKSNQKKVYFSRFFKKKSFHSRIHLIALFILPICEYECIGKQQAKKQYSAIFCQGILAHASIFVLLGVLKRMSQHESQVFAFASHWFSCHAKNSQAKQGEFIFCDAIRFFLFFFFFCTPLCCPSHHSLVCATVYICESHTYHYFFF